MLCRVVVNAYSFMGAYSLLWLPLSCNSTFEQSCRTCSPASTSFPAASASPPTAAAAARIQI
eukprot:scaffold200693_cov10-Tisochrysis_lutea.AAC.1